ncbi:MAG TPA: sialidase family protein [Dehalococcoidia bacterium]|nr:sialidase family protein [Dehalococcoidia bacterium]
MIKRFIFESAPFASCHASTIVETAPGEFLAAWFGGSGEGAADVAIWGASFSGGRWSPPEVLADEPEAPCWNPVLFATRDGRVHLYYKAGLSPQSWSGFFRVRSTDGSWSEPEMLPAGLLGPAKNKPLLLSSGRIVAGTSVESYRAWAAWVELSDDGGRTWRRRGPIAAPGEPRGVIQPAIFETSSGDLRMLLRSARIGRICEARSSDRGETWTAAAPTALANPNSGIDAVRLQDGRVILCHNPLERGRTPLVLSVSEDDGDTWREAVQLESGPGEYSYPAVVQASDGEIHVTYTWRRERIGHAVLAPEDL